MTQSIDGISHAINIKAQETATFLIENDDRCTSLPSVARYETVETSQLCCNASSSTIEVDKIYYDVKQLYDEHIRSCPTQKCLSCSKLLFPEQVKHFKLSTNTSHCMALKTEDNLCNFCQTKVMKDIIPCISTMYSNLDPGIIPLCLKNLTMMEKGLISKVHIFLTLILLPGGQFAEKGLAINFPADIHKTINILPRSQELSGVFRAVPEIILGGAHSFVLWVVFC